MPQYFNKDRFKYFIILLVLVGNNRISEKIRNTNKHCLRDTALSKSKYKADAFGNANIDLFVSLIGGYIKKRLYANLNYIFFE